MSSAELRDQDEEDERIACDKKMSKAGIQVKFISGELEALIIHAGKRIGVVKSRKELYKGRF